MVARSLKDYELGAARRREIEIENRYQQWGRRGCRLFASTSTEDAGFRLQLAMEQRVRRATLLEGDRVLPQAGLLFFEYRGKSKNIRSVELMYDGPAGKATLELQP